MADIGPVDLFRTRSLVGKEVAARRSIQSLA